MTTSAVLHDLQHQFEDAEDLFGGKVYQFSLTDQPTKLFVAEGFQDTPCFVIVTVEKREGFKGCLKFNLNVFAVVRNPHFPVLFCPFRPQHRHPFIFS